MESPETIYSRPKTPVLRKPGIFYPNLVSTTPLPLRLSAKYEDRPVNAPQKTFEELIDEELQKSKEKEDLRLLQKRKLSVQYLKRGQGTLCTNTKSPTPSLRNTQSKLTVPSPTNTITPSKSTTRLPKASSHINTLKNLAKSPEETQVKKKFTPILSLDPEKINIKPLELYKIRREKWKIRENAATDRKSFEKIIEKLSEDEKNEEILRLRRQLQKVRQNEGNLLQEIENFKGKIEELRAQNLKLVNENYRLLKGNQVKVSKKNELIKEKDSEKQEFLYPNGTKRVVYSNGFSVVYYSNKDVKEDFPDGRQVYFFAAQETVQTIYPGGLKEVKFKNGQEEVFYPNGIREVKFADGTVKIISVGNDEKITEYNGTVLG